MVWLLCLAGGSAIAACPERSISVAGVTEVAGRETSLSISLVGTGNENGLSFSLSFDPARLAYVGQTSGAGAAGTSLFVNTNQVSLGQLGLLLAKPAGQSFGAGSNELARIRFLLSSSAATTTVSFADAPLGREVVDANANVLCANYSNAQVAITPLFLPTILADPLSQTIQPITNIATNVTFSVTAGGSPPLRYQWRWNGASLAGASNTSLTLTNAGPAQAGNYDVMVANDGGAVTSRVAVLTLLQTLIPPTILSNPRSQLVSTGETVYLTVAVSGSSPLSYQWQRNSSSLDQATNSVLVLTNITVAQAGSYSVVVRNNAGAATSQAATITVSTDLRVVRVVSTAVATAGTVEVPVELVGFGDESAVGFSLNFDPAALSFLSVRLGSGASGAGLLVNTNSLGSGRVGIALTRQAGQTFASGTNQLVLARFRAGNASGATALAFGDQTIARELADVLANPRPVSFRDGMVNVLATAPSITQDPQSLTVPIFSQAVLQAGVAGSTPLSYQWQRNGADLLGATGSALTLNNATPSMAGGYRLIVTNAAGSATSGVAMLTVPRVVRAGTTNGPTGNLVELPVELLAAGDENAVGFSLDFDPAKMTAAGVTPGGALHGAALNFNTNQPGHVGVVAAQPNNAVFGFGTQEVARIQFLLGQQPGTNTPVWSDVPITRDLADTNANSLTVQFLPGALGIQLVPPQVTRQPAPQTVWVGDSVTLDLVVSGSKPMSWQWQKNGADLSGATNTALTITNVQSGDGGNYSVRISNAAGGVSSASALLTVLNARPDLFVSGVAAPATATAGQTVSVTWNLFNNGNANVPAGWWHTLWLAADAAGDNPQFVAALPFTTPLPAGQSLSVTGQVVLPAAVLGDRYFMVWADGSNNVAELNENNNVAVASQSSHITSGDLVLNALSVPASAQVGQTISVIWVVTNTASTPATGPWQDRLYLGSSPNSLAGALTLLTVQAPATTLAAGAAYTNAQQVALPGSAQVSPGTYYLTALADCLNNVTELTRTNNSRTVPILLAADYFISASNSPPAAGSVVGIGYYLYGATSVLTATANFGYRFANWTEGGVLVSQNVSLTNIVTSDRFFVANYVEANTFHVVTTATTPTNVAVMTGAGTYTNGQTVAFSVPLSVTNSPNIYNFRQFQLNGAPAGNSASFNKTFSTLDPTNIQYVAVYDTVSILPLVTNVTRSIANVVPATTNFVLSFQFNRSMNISFTPLVELTNPAVALQAVVPAGGLWSAGAVANDTFSTLPITFSTGMDGTNFVWISMARDLGGGQLVLTNPLSFVVDVTPPPNPLLSLTASNSSSATVSWSGYSAPADLNSFRVYLATNSFTSVTGLTAISSLGTSARSYTYYSLSLDQPYYAAIAAVDIAGNSSPLVMPLAFSLPSTVPPPVAIQVAAVGVSSAQVSWNSYNTSSLLGFAGFQLYYETNNFTSVAGLTARQVLGAGTRSVQVDGLDRTRSYYFAVVGFNVNNATNSSVTTAAWTDPYAGQISASTTIGGAGQGVVDILHDITVVNNAVVTIPAGTTLRFAPGTGLIVQQGSLNANGTPLDPIFFTSGNEQPGLTAAAGDWNGIVLGNGAGASVLRNVFIKYGAGLAITNCSPAVDALTALFNTPAGLTVAGSAVLSTTSALLTANDVGARQFGAAQLTIVNSVLKNNGTNALAYGGLNLQANQDWWGSANPADIDALLRGAVDRTGFLSGEPLLTPALGTVNNVTQVGGQAVNLRLACRTADTMRLSEDSTFTSVFFGSFSNLTTFPLSSGGGLKNVFAQFRSVTGQTSAPVSVSVTYITTGPTISAFSLSEGMVLSRPVVVTGSASALLGMSSIELYVDGIGQATNFSGSFSFWLDVRNFSSAIHRIGLLARDNSGNIATRELNVVIAPTSPPAPNIAVPSSDLVVNTNNLLVSGTAEPYVQVKLFRSGSLVGTTNAAADGSFTFQNVSLSEGANQLTAQAADALGTASSPIRLVTLDTMPPAQLVVDPPSYQPGVGLNLTWRFPATGKRATTFQVLWSTVPINNAADAAGSTLLLSSTSTTLQGLATTNYYFYVVGYDATGNQSPLSVAVRSAYDAVPPSFSIGFNKASPVGVGSLHLVLSASEPLNAAPTLTVQPNGSAPSLVTLSNTALNTYEADINVTTLLPSGPVQFRVSAADLAGNTFNGAPSGPAMVIDVTPPSGYISTALVPPIQTTTTTNVNVSLQLTEVPQPATTPTLAFGPPIGASVPVDLSGSGTNWTGTLTLAPAMGSGVGHFTLTVVDSLGNVGHSILSGSALEIYNTALPTPPAQPVNFHAASSANGKVQLTWDPLDNAEMYRVYSETGTTFTVPTVLVADNVASNQYVDLPPADGYYRYVVTASRRGAEGPASIVRVALSDRTPPPAPTNVLVQLAASGLQITWQASSGETPDHYNVYRNGSLIRTVSSVTPVIDNPPRGVMSYTVASVDSLGNEALSDPVSFQLLVGAVNNLQALVTIGQAPVLTWTSADPTAVGFNVYRNGIKQNGSLLTSSSYTDSLPPGSAGVTYAVTALNSTNAEGAARSLNVYGVDLALLVNASVGSTSGPPTLSYFDDYQITVSNLTAAGSLPLQQVEVQRSVQSSVSLNVVIPVNSTVGAGSWFTSDWAVPCSSNSLVQSVRVRAVQQTDSAGSSVIYQENFDLPSVQVPGVMINLSANQLPLAGGLTPFNVQVYNRGYKPIYVATTRGNGSLPGDVYISVRNSQDQEVSRTPFNGSPPGMLFADGAGYVIIPPGNFTSFTVPDVFVPLALASNTVTFQAVVGAIYDRAAATGQQQSGPLFGTMQSDLAQTPYYGTAQTDHALYANDQPVVVTGQALDRITSQPVPNVPLQIGFSTRGHRWANSVTTDTNGNYSYTYIPPPGLAGTLTLWAAHPDVYDQLNQAQITIYRIYASPPSGDIRMSKNGTLPFNISLINPGDLPLTSFGVGFQAYQIQGTNQVPLTKLHGTNLAGADFYLAGGEQKTVTLQLAADADAPDNAVAVFTLTSAEGAAATFTGSVTLLPAVPVLSVVQPDIGYVEVGLNRGTLLSRQVTVVNRGLKDLQGVSVQPPTNVTWMALNLSPNPDGTIPLPDILVGQSNSFTVVFTPPTNTVLGFFQDKLTIRGTNATANFDVNLYARVTSANQGAVQFYVDDILGLDVPNATVRLRNVALQSELPPVQTDINGLVTVTNLQEGDWSWQISAPGHSANVGVVTVAADQTVDISTRLSKSVVTVNFTVTPVPFTDRYEITIEQTFETHVPVPVLVLTPVYQHFDNVTPGFQASFIVIAKNEGLIQMSDLSIIGTQTDSASFTPLINYVPVLLPQQSIEIPFTLSYFGTNAPTQQGGAGSAIASCSGMPNMEAIAGFIDGMAAFAKAYAQCAKDQKWIAACATVAVTYMVVTSVTKGAKAVAGALQGGLGLAKYLGCILGKLIGPIPTIGIPLAIITDPPGQSTQQFEPIEAGCFAADTRVLLADGTFKTIDHIKPGDVVKSGPGLGERATVTAVYQRKVNTWREIHFVRPGQAEPDLVRTTDEHLFWEDGKGWVVAAELKVGGWLMNEHRQRVQITANKRISTSREVYTLKLRGDTAFYANGLLVHDLCGAFSPSEPVHPDSAPAEPSAVPINLSK